MAQRKIYPVIMSGGSGTRLWPLSRAEFPKQFLELVTDRSMFQETLLRLKTADAGLRRQLQPPIIVSNAAHQFVIERQLCEIACERLAHVLEPAGRNTAPVAVLAAELVREMDPDGLLLFLAADHHIELTAQFEAAITLAAEAASEGYLTSFGIVAQLPETGYGYIRKGAAIEGVPGAFRIAQFVEKPTRAAAEHYITEGGYYWNSGMFLFGVAPLLTEMERWRPDIRAAAAEALKRARRAGGAIHLDAAGFSQCPSDSIDYAVMEKTNAACIVPCDIGWSDIGSFTALWQVGQKDAAGNVAAGNVHLFDSHGNFVRAEGRLVATLGVANLVIVETGDAILVADKARSQDIKSVVDSLRKTHPAQATSARIGERHWGRIERIGMACGQPLDLIEIDPRQSLRVEAAAASSAALLLAGLLNDGLGGKLRPGASLPSANGAFAVINDSDAAAQILVIAAGEITAL